MVFTFSALDQKNSFWLNQVKKNQNFQFKLKFGTRANLNQRNSMMMLNFPVFDHTYLSWANLVLKFKIVCSKWNLIQRLIRICKIPWWCLFICFRLKIAILFGKFGPKNRISQFKLKIGTYTYLNMKNLIVMFIFLCFWPEVYFFFWKCVPKIKIVCRH